MPKIQKRIWSKTTSLSIQKGNKSKIQNLISKVHIDADRIETEVQFGDGTANDEGGRNDKSTNKDEKLIS